MKKIKYVCALHYNTEDKYCTHTNLMGTQEQIDQWIKDQESTGVKIKTHSMSENEYLKDKYHSVDLTQLKTIKLKEIRMTENKIKPIEEIDPDLGQFLINIAQGKKPYGIKKLSVNHFYQTS